jgi:hypothetical protein
MSDYQTAAGEADLNGLLRTWIPKWWIDRNQLI